MKRIDVILDCDPGIDDALAIALALSKENLNVLAITTVIGNVDCEKTTRNAKLLLNLLQSDIPLAQGAKTPLVKAPLNASGVHGEDGFGNLSAELGSDDYPHFVDQHATLLMAQILEEAVEPITIIAVGPLTNVALLIKTFPHLTHKIKEISIMGGGLGLGNRTSAAEFNILVDPEAAHIVFNSGIPLIVATLNATYQARLEKEDIDKFDFVSNDITKFINRIMWRYGELDSALHDPVSVLAISNPELFETKEIKLNVETNEGATRGMTYEDHKGNQTGTRIITKLEREKIIDEIVKSFQYFND